MKKICSITTIPTSMENFMYPEALGLLKAGWDSVVITNFDEKSIKSLPKELRHYSVPMERSYNIKIACKCIFKLYKIFRKERFDVVQYGTTHACLFGSIASFFARVPHRVFLQWGPIGYNDYTGIKRFLTKSIEVLIGKLSTTIRTTSQKNLAESVKDGLYPESKASVVGEGGTIGVDLNNFKIELRDKFRQEIRTKYNIGENDIVFGFAGRLSKPKGINELLEAFKVVSKDLACKLMLVGPDESVSDVPLMDWAKGNPNVIFTGGIKHQDMPKFFAVMDFLVHPTYREGFGMVLQEAMAIGTPIITTDIPGPSEVIENGKSGILVKVKDATALAQAMASIGKNPIKCEIFGQEGRRRVELHFERSHRVALLVNDKNKLLKSK